MCTRGQCVKHMGQWVQFRTPWGTHRGIISDINNRGVLMRVPRQYAPVSLAYHSEANNDDEQKLDLALAGWGYSGYPGAYGAAPGYGGRWGYPGAGAWYGGWWLWWLAFAWIFWLAFLW